MLKLREVAERLNCSLGNVYSLVAAGMLPVVPTGAHGKGERRTWSGSSPERSGAAERARHRAGRYGYD